MSLCVLALAIGASAAEPFIAIADVETGRALVPEGTVVPAGVRFFITNHGRVADGATDAASRERVPLVFAYAPASRFVAAQKVIAAARASAAPTAMRVITAPDASPRRRVSADRFRIATDDDPEWFYLYFEDGSYTSALRHVFVQGSHTWYGSGTVAYSAPGSYWTGTVSVSLSSNLVWGPTGGPYFDPYGYSNSCSIGSSGGSCSTQYPYVATTEPFSATVESEGSILQRFGGCWNPNSPCLRYYSGTIQITFP